MKVQLISSLILVSTLSHAKMIKVAVIDTGINPETLRANMLCETGHRDFTKTSIVDSHGHGTHISGIIDQHAKGITLENTDHPQERYNKLLKLKQTKINYCQVVIKFFDKDSKVDSTESMVAALEWAIKLKVDIINISGGGEYPNPDELKLVKKALNMGIIIVGAAGNNGKKLEKGEFAYYPASADNRVIVVGNLNKNLTKNSTSNYGKIVDIWTIGTSVLSYSRSSLVDIVPMSGTSQATAVITGKIINKKLK